MSKDENNKMIMAFEFSKTTNTNLEYSKNMVEQIYGKCCCCYANRNHKCANIKSIFLNKEVNRFDSCEYFKCYVEF